MTTTINLTQHTATPEQGCTEVRNKEFLKALLTFNEIPTKSAMEARAAAICFLAAETLGEMPEKAMIGGAPFFMSTLEKALKERGVQPVYAFSRRESVEEIQEDGSVIKKNVFKHICFVEAEYKENGHLMAAAPELYEALEMLVSNSSVQVAQPNDCEIAEKALAKARGES